jgi:hypothetical protein
MSYHSQNGHDFLGLRQLPDGKLQIVYDATSGERVLVVLRDRQIVSDDIDQVLREGIRSEKVLSAVLTALTQRNIKFDMAGDAVPGRVATTQI